MKVFHPTASGAAVQGASYARGEDGSFEVAGEHVAELESHGFTKKPPEADPRDAEIVDLKAKVAELEEQLAKKKTKPDKIEK